MINDNQIRNGILKKIANVMSLNIPQETGLFNGKTGMAMFMYLYSRQCGSALWEDEADLLMGDVLSSLSQVSDNSVATGLSGIALGLHHMIGNGFMESAEDQDQLFCSIDKALAANSFPVCSREAANPYNYFSVGTYISRRLGNGVLSAQKLRLVTRALDALGSFYANPNGTIRGDLRHALSALPFLDGLLGKGICGDQALEVHEKVYEYVREFVAVHNVSQAEMKAVQTIYGRSREPGRVEGLYRMVKGRHEASLSPDENEAGEHGREEKEVPVRSHMWDDMMFGREERIVEDWRELDHWLDMQLEEMSPQRAGVIIELGLWLSGADMTPGMLPKQENAHAS